jgi:trimeric autotransporter adhesin
MRRAEFAVVPASAWHPARLPVLRSARPVARMLGLLGAAILATVVAVSMPGHPVRRAPVTWANGSTGLPVAAWAPVSRSLGAAEPGYRVTPGAGGFAVRNVRQALGVQFSPAGASVRSGDLRLGMRLRAYGYGNRLHVVAAVAPIASGNRVVYRHGSVAEWYVNGLLGLEQGFTIAARPGGLLVGH